jgi:hypothetical protein
MSSPSEGRSEGGSLIGQGPAAGVGLLLRGKGRRDGRRCVAGFYRFRWFFPNGMVRSRMNILFFMSLSYLVLSHFESNNLKVKWSYSIPLKQTAS